MWKEWLGEARIKDLAKADWIKKIYHSVVNQLYSNIKFKKISRDMVMDVMCKETSEGRRKKQALHWYPETRIHSQFSAAAVKCSQISGLQYLYLQNEEDEVYTKLSHSLLLSNPRTQELANDGIHARKEHVPEYCFRSRNLYIFLKFHRTSARLSS